MIRSKSELVRLLDELDAGMPDMIEKIPEAGDFWAAFGVAARHITDAASAEDSVYVHGRIDVILTSHGLEPAAWDTPDDISNIDQIEPTNNR
ncbi:hypothetical protein ELE36_13370 [Pseudolysobacter antarcticus]|uniref:Uncharacterized protein n=1 Tax=Pseudolysobacter antarcticus TaxID=2511995 RepID=A0A411HL89_9GAMM|nr:hypothetical protein [Pseudolysobacter antarcticus]QBB71263.1 hypothetical protein ELE36_13370 [Pseudolysobacter antarcticus]